MLEFMTSNPAGTFDVEIFLRFSTLFRRWFDVESTSIFRRVFIWRRKNVEKPLKNRRRNFDGNSTSKFRLARWVKCINRQIGNYIAKQMNLQKLFCSQTLCSWRLLLVKNKQTKTYIYLEKNGGWDYGSRNWPLIYAKQTLSVAKAPHLLFYSLSRILLFHGLFIPPYPRTSDL